MSAAPRLLLASASPARAATLRAAGIDPLVRASAVDEEAVVAERGVSEPAAVALLLARAKAEDVAADLARAGGPDLADGALVLGCDSLLELDGRAYGKPADAAEARQRWRRMSGRSGVLHTGHWLVDARQGSCGAATGAVASTRVHFATVENHEIDAYVATGEPLGVAGAFTTDGLGGAFVRGIEGDHHAVVGVSLPLLRELVTALGVRWVDLWRADLPRLRSHGATG